MAEKHLFVVSVNIGMMILAEDEEDARLLADVYFQEEATQVPPERGDFIVSEVKRHRIYAEGWSDDDVPYNHDEDDTRTIGEIYRELSKRGVIR